VAALSLLLVAACSPAVRSPAPGAEREYPCILHSPDQFSPDFSVSQHVEAAAQGRTGGFDSVLQKHGNELVIVGLGPAGIRAFVLKQSGDAITFERMIAGPELPFSPRNVLVDVHRAFFKRLPQPPGSPGAGTFKGVIDGEEVEEDWRDDNLLERRFRRPGTSYQGAVRVTYAPGCTRQRCAPSKFRLVNEWFGYALEIDCTDYNWLS
jgi:hypothetical protein